LCTDKNTEKEIHESTKRTQVKEQHPDPCEPLSEPGLSQNGNEPNPNQSTPYIGAQIATKHTTCAIVNISNPQKIDDILIMCFNIVPYFGMCCVVVYKDKANFSILPQGLKRSKWTS
jgi:hypothetical protein